MEASPRSGGIRNERSAGAWQQWVEQPQRLLLRRILFQIHLWVGIAVGLYVAAISVSGSAIVCRRELARMGRRKKVVLVPAGRPRMGREEAARMIRRAYPGYEVLSMREPEQPGQPDVAVLERHNQRIARLFNPYTGADLGDPRSETDRVLAWLVDLHDNLLSGLTGRTWNGLGSFVLVLLAFTGAMIWWPGRRNWRRSTSIRWRARFARVVWDLHSAAGFWCLFFVLVWGISGIGLCFPGVLDPILSAEIRVWITRLHFGRFNLLTEVLWTMLGLAPAVLAGTGALMWWNRILSKKLRGMRARAAARMPA
jgi:uncharacterized iron-regulated membrane protein